MFDQKPQNMLFRQSAVDALAQTEDLDQLIHIIKPAAWLKLAAVGLVVALAVVWGIWGSIPVKVPGRGILIRGGGLYQAVALQDGQIKRILVQPGQLVKPGQVLAELDRPELRDEISALGAELADLRSLPQVGPESRLRVRALERRLEMLTERYRATTRIISPHAGQVLEILADSGDIVNRGAPLVTLERSESRSGELEAVCFVPAAEGKKIKVGMEAEISPASVKKEEYGVLLGRVSRVATFPSSNLGMIRILKNEKLVKALTSGGAAMAVHVRLISSKATPSGYTWSTPQGPPLVIHSGELCSLAVTIRQQRPLSILFPKLH